ncbi:MAG: glutamine synthetase III [Prolixibacteraceae bacterium]|nr:glutamine synthetase III [Prolixibacteraceae bacterium]
MAAIRFSALATAFEREIKPYSKPKAPVSEYFGCNVFDKKKMKKYLSNEAYTHVLGAIEQGTRIDRKIADQIASGMKAWAVEMGATHYTHWFQPLTESTAEKHDAFIDFADDGQVIESFSGKLLAQQEPDASSFPSGGIRNTFEARGYTAWDPSSPAFVIGNTLSIPTIFVSYTGEALDNKTPLLKALHAVDKAAVDVCQYFDKDVNKVIATLGVEQEYFLIDEALYNARPDIVLTGRSLMGHASAKDQQLEDHYFGSIPERVTAFIDEFETEAYKLGIPVKTRHDEVAPNQFECAPIFEECNLAVDHNVLLMDMMRRIARHHKFAVLHHEKPFNHINGSGKHCNWALATNTGVNLFSPGKNPKSNLQFLTFLVNTLKAVHKHADLLRASVASPGNAHRLGANEAPPAIISAFIGKQLTDMLNALEKKVGNEKMSPNEKTELKLNVIKVPSILLDNTDRNRTSPFAFTGNKFEFRAVGSSASPAVSMIALNSAMAEQLKEFKKDVDKLIEKDVKKDEAIFQVLRKYITESKPIRFEGNNYSDEWKKEAKKRGLTNISNPVEAFDAYLTPKSKKLFTSLDVMTDRENEARTHIRWDYYTKRVQIEARVMGDLVMNHVVPVAIRYQSELIANVKGLKELFGDKEYKELAGARLELIKNISYHVSYIKAKVSEMIEARKVANKIENEREKAMEYATKIFCYLDDIRYHVDKLELIVDDEYWPLPKYRELLFIR